MPTAKNGHTQTVGGNQIKNEVLKKLKKIAKHDKRSQAAELEWLIEQRYSNIEVEAQQYKARCLKCGKEFNTMTELAQHTYDEHRDTMPVEWMAYVKGEGK